MDESFLPPEILEKILSYESTLLVKSLSLSKSVYSLMGPAFLRKIRLWRIRYNELRKYIESRPERLAFFRWESFQHLNRNANEESPVKFIYDCLDSFYFEDNLDNNYTLICGNTYLIDRIYEHNSPFLLNPTVLLNPIVLLNPHAHTIPRIKKPLHYFYINDQLDLLSIYHILDQRAVETAERLNCQHINRNFVKEYILSHFNNIIQGEYLKWSRIPILAKMQLYLYLYTNAKILQIKPELMYLEYSFIVDVPQRDNEGMIILNNVHNDIINNPQYAEPILIIENEISYLIDLIKEKLEKL